MSSVFEARDDGDFFSRLNKATKSCGFEMFMVAVEVVDRTGSTVRHVVSSYPLSWQRTYVEREYANNDPTVAHCQRNTAPIVWSESLFTAAHAQPFFEEAQSHGIKHGVSAAVHERVGAKSMLSLTRDKPLDLHPGESAELMAAAQVLSSCAHVAASRLLSTRLDEPRRNTLTPQEKTCLRWVSQGKTAWEIGQIMNVSHYTVVFHLKNIMAKLNVVNRSQAVAAAIWLGLLD